MSQNQTVRTAFRDAVAIGASEDAVKLALKGAEAVKRKQ